VTLGGGRGYAVFSGGSCFGSLLWLRLEKVLIKSVGILRRLTQGISRTLGLRAALGVSLALGAGAALGLGTVLCLDAPAAKAETAETERAAVTDFVEKLNAQSNALLAAPSPDGARAILDWAFDVPAMGQYALGPAWDTASEAEREVYLSAFEDVLVSAYLRNMRTYRGAKMTLAGVRNVSQTRATAASRLLGGKVDKIWIWRMRKHDAAWRIADVTIDGRSVLYAEKQDYQEILEANKGDINAVIAFIRRRT